MRKIFIDANIYLGFFNSNKPEFKRLLISLVELREKIFVTHQIIDEVNRNKLNVFRASCENYIKQANVLRLLLPEHLDNGLNPAIKNWNIKRKEIENNAVKLNEELTAIVGNIIADISFSRDNLSVELNKIFANPLKPLTNTYKTAKVRKETGNPPGKNNDPIGDQLNWVQLLENIKEVKEVWIVTNDYDYYTEFNKQLFLNPFLQQELLNINSTLQVFVFNSLADALKDFNNKEPIISLPAVQDLDKISDDEPRIIQSVLSSKLKYFGGGYAVPLKCPACLSENTLVNGSYLKSVYGGITYQYICSYCGYHYDTGNFWQ